MTDEKRYLAELEIELNDDVNQIKSLEEADDLFKKIRLILRAAIKKEDKLRKKSEIGVRFNVVRTQLQAILDEFEKTVGLNNHASKKNQEKVEEKVLDDVVVYVYLFNARGLKVDAWSKLLLPRALIEHSVNRPIYAEKEQVERVIRGKSNQVQHAYLAVVINKNDIVKPSYGAALKDQFGYTLLRLRQGSLKVENIQRFVHEGQSYKVAKDGELIVKTFPNDK